MLQVTPTKLFFMHGTQFPDILHLDVIKEMLQLTVHSFTPDSSLRG